MKNAIIIGGTTGIGFELAKILVSKNYKIGITGIETDIIANFQYQEDNLINVKIL